MKIEEKLKLINKLFKKNNLLLEIEMLDYEGCNIYIRLDYFKKDRIHKISWVDLNLIHNKNIKPYINSEYISIGYLDNIANFINNNNLNSIDYHDLDVNDGLVKLKLYFSSGKKFDAIEILFHRYIPKELSFIYDIFVNVFDNLPNKLNQFLNELGAILTGEEEKYNYDKKFKFDLFNDDIDNIFRKIVISKGKRYHKNGKVKFLEEIHGKYYAMVEGTHNYVVIIDYYEESKETKVYCSCPCEFYCEDIYAVILAIRNKEFKKFYKVTYDIDSENVMEKVVGFKYYLCVGINDDKLVLLNNYGMIEYVPLTNSSGKLMWKIIEDDKKNTLKKKLSKFK